MNQLFFNIDEESEQIIRKAMLNENIFCILGGIFIDCFVD